MTQITFSQAQTTIQKGGKLNRGKQTCGCREKDFFLSFPTKSWMKRWRQKENINVASRPWKGEGETQKRKGGREERSLLHAHSLILFFFLSFFIPRLSLGNVVEKRKKKKSKALDWRGESFFARHSALTTTTRSTLLADPSTHLPQDVHTHSSTLRDATKVEEVRSTITRRELGGKKKKREISSNSRTRLIRNRLTGNLG